MKCTALKVCASPNGMIFPRDEDFEVTLAGW